MVGLILGLLLTAYSTHESFPLPFQVCLTSNRQTMPELRDDISKHRLKDMLAHGLCVSICTDNRLVSNTTVVKELLLAIGASRNDSLFFVGLPSDAPTNLHAHQSTSR